MNTQNYTEVSEAAARYERESDFQQAAQKWLESSQLTESEHSKHWSLSRAKLCITKEFGGNAAIPASVINELWKSEPEKNDAGQRLYWIRTLRNETVKSLSRGSDVSVLTIQHAENGTVKRPSDDVLDRIAQHLKVSGTWLKTGLGVPFPILDC